IEPWPAMAVHLHHPYPLLLDLPGGRAADRDELLQRLDVYRGGVLPHEEVGPTPTHLEEPPRNAEVAVPKPEVPGGAVLEHLVEQSTLLGVGILAGHSIDDQAQVEVVDHQGLAREHGLLDVAGLRDAVFGARQVIAVEDLNAVTRQGGGAAR